MTDNSFYVHLKSLVDFARELETQLQGILSPSNQLDSLQTTPMLLGAFAEASELAQAHQAAAAEMLELLSQVKQAIDFAENVTKVVATGYEQADQSAAGSMGGGTNPGYTSPAYLGDVGGVAGQLVNGAGTGTTGGATQFVSDLINNGGATGGGVWS